VKKLFKTVRKSLDGVYKALYGFVLHSFKSMNRRIKSKFPVYRMKEETTEHVQQAVTVFSWLILPLSLVYLFGSQIVLGQTVLWPTLWGVTVYFYSNFLPDLPSVYRRKKTGDKDRDIPWYKKYTILLLAPILIWLLFCGLRLTWRTTDTFHNFKALAVYGASLGAVGFLGFSGFPILIGDILKILFFLSCGVIGFLAHLKVDKIWKNHPSISSSTKSEAWTETSSLNQDTSTS
jgi:hypothetical protein